MLSGPFKYNNVAFVINIGFTVEVHLFGNTRRPAIKDNWMHLMARNNSRYSQRTCKMSIRPSNVTSKKKKKDLMRVCGSVDGLGAMLKARRSRIRVPIAFFNLRNPSDRTKPWGLLSL
jgi:hypothetical protein